MPSDDIQNTRPRPLSPCSSDVDPVSSVTMPSPLDWPNHFLPSETASNTPHLPKSLLPAFPSRQCSQLPTPQSPNDFASYVEHKYQHSPSSHAPCTSLVSSTEVDRSKAHDVPDSRMMTPDTSPLNSRWAAPYDGDRLHAQSLFHLQPSPFAEPSSSVHVPDRALTHDSQSAPSVKLEPLTLDHTTTIAPALSTAPSSRLTSPFVPRTPTSAKSGSQHQPPASQAALRMDSPSMPHCSFQKAEEASSSTPLSLVPSAKKNPSSAGGEMDRLRQSMFENRIALMKEVEHRRPDYLKREKRAANAGSNMSYNIDEFDHEQRATISITDSPNKGRRLKLFQETSEESFEESLMAGGYGRYRTTEWVRQPQPLTLAATNIAGPSNVVTLLEQAQEVPISERELKKRKRLEAFKRDKGLISQMSSLFPTELEGKGRVLIDPTYQTRKEIGNDNLSTKKRSGGRKKRINESIMKEEPSPVAKQVVQWPNWVDREFPWRLRTEEVAGEKKVAEENRLKLIERYLDRDSDNDEGEAEEEKTDLTGAPGPYYQEESQIQRAGMGGGKMVPLVVKPYSIRSHSWNDPLADEKKMFPCDPADARVALLAKKSVRTLSYRMRRKKQPVDTSALCICNDPDDGRPLVQCDGCQAWYHLHCIGINDIAELGREEDLWFCRSCENKNRASSGGPEGILSSEPTFVPTDDEPRIDRTHDTPFFQPSSPHNSPSWSFGRVPKTPTQRSSDHDLPGLSSGSSWVNSSRHGPSTPQQRSDGHIYSRDPDNYPHPFEESPFDPASTPSRGIKFTAPFMTPKNTVWSMRPYLLQTPSKPSGRTANHSMLTPATDDPNYRGSAWFSPLGRFSGPDESQMRKYLESPLLSRSHSTSLVEESPILRSKGKGKT